MAFQEAINTHPHSISIPNPHLDKTDSTDTTDIDNKDINWTSGDFIPSEQYHLVKNLKSGTKVKKKAVAFK